MKDQAAVRRVPTADLTPAEVSTIRELLWDAFGPGEEGMTEDDWQHALGGTHFLIEVDGRIVAHASVVEREIRVDDRPLRTGYVEAVATAPERQGAGLGSRLMAEVGAHVRDRFELGVLGSGRHRFYQRLGWRSWAGPLFVRTSEGLRRTPDDEGFLLVLTTPASPPLDLAAPISCDWRQGDVW
jgi:aminoglycoside 2'-N-acetyltransferase I